VLIKNQGKALSGEASNQASNNGSMITAGLGALGSLGAKDAQVILDE